MHPRTQEVLSYLDAGRAQLEQAVAAIPEEARSTNAAPGRWSVAQVLEHLSLVERRIGGLIVDQLDKARAMGIAADSETSLVVPTLDVRSLLDRSQKIAARENAMPVEGLPAAEGLKRVNEQRCRLRNAILTADGSALGSVTAEHPRLGRLNLHQWIVFLGAHEQRHVMQITESASHLM